MSPLRSISHIALVTLALPTLWACGAEESQGADAGASAADASVLPDGGIDCGREAGPPNAERFVVVARPYTDEGQQSGAWEVLTLATDGTLSATGSRFDMGRASGGVVEFTPDGKLGFVALDDGSLGVFRIDDDGNVTVLQNSLNEEFYASGVSVGADGNYAYVLSANWRENGGGIARLAIGCDDSIVDEGLVAAGKLPWAMRWTSTGDALVAADDLGDSPLEQDLHLVATNSFASPLASTTVFPDRDAIVGSMAITADDRFVLLGDNSGFSGLPNRVGVARLDSSGIEEVQVLTPIDDPFAIATSPFDDAAIVVSGFGNAIFKLSYDPANATAPFENSGELAYQGARPQLPADLVQITRGDLLGLVLIAENQGLRRVRFEGGGAVTDLGLSAFGESFAAIVGAVGVQP